MLGVMTDDGRLTGAYQLVEGARSEAEGKYVLKIKLTEYQSVKLVWEE